MVVQAPLSARPTSARPIGFVVAGGLSTRMGRDKALLPWQGGSTLIDHAIARLAAVCTDVRVLCGPTSRYADRGRPLVVDASLDARPIAEGTGLSTWRPGPLAGLAAGLASAGDVPGLYLAVDLPLVGVDLLAALAALIGHADAVVPVTASGPEPLCAVYAPRCLGAVRARLAAGDLRMTSFWPDVRVHTLEGPALAAFGDPDRMFRNLNAPADYHGMAGGPEGQS